MTIGKVAVWGDRGSEGVPILRVWERDVELGLFTPDGDEVTVFNSRDTMWRVTGLVLGPDAPIRRFVPLDPIRLELGCSVTLDLPSSDVER